MATVGILPALIEIVSKHDQRLVNHDFALRQIEAKLKELQVQKPPRTITAEQVWDILNGTMSEDGIPDLQLIADRINHS